jgi:Mg2+ and Co2+ transporter CorA
MINPKAMRVNTIFNRRATYYRKDIIGNGSTLFNSFDDLLKDKGKEWIEEEIGAPYTFWLDFSNPTTAQLNLVGSIFQLHPLTIEDLKEASGTDRESCIKYENYFQLVTQSVKTGATPTSSLSPIIILVFSSFILTFHNGGTHQHPITLQLEKRNEDLTPDRVLICCFQHIFDIIAPFSRYFVIL